MEQKRTIWIVLAAGIFLSVVLGAAVILYASEAKKNTTALYQRSAGSVWMSPETAQQKHAESFSNGIPSNISKSIVFEFGIFSSITFKASSAKSQEITFFPF